MSWISSLFQGIRVHKKKILIGLAGFLFFLVVLFPYNDLGDYAANQISQMTRGQVSLQFDTMQLRVLPRLGLSFVNVTVDSAFFSALKTDELIISPNILSLIAFKPGISLYAMNFLSGNLDVDLQMGEKLASGQRKQVVHLDGEELDLSELNSILQIPGSIKGRAQMNIELQIDPTYTEQPSGKINILLSKIATQGLQIKAGMLGSVPLPDLSFSSVRVQGDLKKSRLTLQRLSFGESQDELQGMIEGTIDVNVQQGMGGMDVVPTSYDLNVDLKLKSAFQNKLAQSGQDALLSFIQAGRKASSDGGAHYAFKASASSMNAMAKITPLP